MLAALFSLGKRGLLGGDPLFTAGGCGRRLFLGQPLRHTVSWSQKVCGALSDKALQGYGAGRGSLGLWIGQAGGGEGLEQAVLGGWSWSWAPWTGHAGNAGGGDGHLLTAVPGDGTG